MTDKLIRTTIPVTIINPYREGVVTLSTPELTPEQKVDAILDYIQLNGVYETVPPSLVVRDNRGNTWIQLSRELRIQGSIVPLTWSQRRRVKKMICATRLKQQEAAENAVVNKAYDQIVKEGRDSNGR